MGTGGPRGRALLQRLDPSGQRALVGPMVPLLAARGSTQLASAAVAVLVARAVGPDRFGIFAALTALASLVVGGSSSGLPVMALRGVASGAAWRGFTRSLCIKALTLGAVATLATVATASVLYGGREAATLAAVASCAFVALTLLTIVSAVRSAHGRFGLAAGGELAGGVVTVALVALSLSAGLGLAATLAAMAVGPLTGAALIGRKIADTEPDGRVDGTVLAFRNLLPFIALGLASTGYLRLDAALLGPLTSPSTLGLYAAAYRVLGIFSLIGSAFGTVFFARVAASPGSRRPLRAATVVLLGLVAAPAAVVFVFAPSILTTAFGSSYAGASTSLRILMVSVVPWSLYWPIAHYLNASGRERHFAAILATSAGADAIGLLLLAPPFGAAGAAAAWVAAESVTLALCLLALRRSRPRRQSPHGVPQLPGPPG